MYKQAKGMNEFEWQRTGFETYSNAILKSQKTRKRITLDQHKSDNNNLMIQVTDVFCVLLRDIDGTVISDYNKRLILLDVNQLSGGQCT
jgi:hypothetical protein